MAVEYRLSMPAPHTHLFHVEVRVPSVEAPIDLVMPSWTPGSYLLREYPRNVQDFEALDSSGLPLPWRKTDKGRWRVQAPEAGPLLVRYRVYANELSVRTSHLDASHGYVNGASVFMYCRGMEGEEIRLAIDAPDDWRVATSLKEDAGGRFLADDYDELVDCPIEIGAHRTLAWEQEGIGHRYAIWGDGEVDAGRLLDDTRRIVGVCSEMFGGLPYDRFLFIVHITADGRGGLEHRTSTSLLVSRSSLAGDEYEKLISLVAHEFFHVWLGKRIRPEPLGPYDYTRENYTRNLWVVEGLTTYYTDLILVRAGLMTPRRYLARLGDAIGRHEALPGRAHQSLEESSFDAWIRFYRPDAHTPNSQVSYYQKGALVAMALDLEIRRASRGERSLDDVMRVLWNAWKEADAGFPEEGAGGIQEVMEGVYGGSLDGIVEAYVRGVAEIDFDTHLDAAGLALVGGAEGGGGGESGEAGGRIAEVLDADGRGADARVPTERTADGVGGGAGLGAIPGGVADQPGPGDDAEGSPRREVRANGPKIVAPAPHEARLGLRVSEVGGRVRVTHVLEGLPAYDAGVNVGDEIVAVDGVRATTKALDERSRGAVAGETIELTTMRRERMLTVAVRVGAAVARRDQLALVDDPSEAQVAVLRGWLGRSAGSPGEV